MRTLLHTVTGGVVLVAVGGATAYWAASGNSPHAAPTPTALVQPRSTPLREFAALHSEVSHPMTVEQVGNVVAITDTSLTAISSDGTIRTYLITPLTTAVTVAPSRHESASSQFSLNDLVSIVGTVDGGTFTATVLVDQALADGNGPPMDG